MAQHEKTKLKLLYLRHVLEEGSPDGPDLTINQIIDYLAELDIPSERKSLYRDINTLREFGDEITVKHAKHTTYELSNRIFTFEDLMVIADAVASCKAISNAQQKELVEKIERLASKYQRKMLKRAIHVKGRIENKRKSVFGNLDLVQEALNKGIQITFRYRHANERGELVPEKDYVREVTPLEISYDEGFYYMSAWDDRYADDQPIREYRLDRMVEILLTNEPAIHNDEIEEYKNPIYSAEMFGHFKGNEKSVQLKCPVDKCEIILDRFSHIDAPHVIEGVYYATVRVCVSHAFYGWLAGLNGLVQIAKPSRVASDYVSFLREQYESALEDAEAQGLL